VDNIDPDQRERGHGLPPRRRPGLAARAPGIFTKLADGDREARRPRHRPAYLEQVSAWPGIVGPANLAKDQRSSTSPASAGWPTTPKAAATSRTRIDELREYLKAGGRNELETYRRLADLYARRATDAVINGVMMVETGLTYNSTDADFLRKRDTFYYSVDVEKLAAVRDAVEKWFNVDYCYRKAMALLNAKGEDLELLDWATHLAPAGEVMKPASNSVRLVGRPVSL